MRTSYARSERGGYKGSIAWPAKAASPLPASAITVADGQPVIGLPRSGARRHGLERSFALKRILDVAVAALALIALAPLMLCIAAAIRLQDGGPALFRQRRGGLNGEPFMILKFRTMSVQEDGDQIKHAAKKDERVTRLGSFLRRTSLDELPQLLNVLRGDMSLVGPRPHALAHDQYYGERVEGYAGRFAVLPGITGLAQVSHCRGGIGALGDMESRVHFDLEYIERGRLLLDLQILFRTAAKVFGDKNAY